MRDLINKKCISCENKEIRSFSKTEAKDYLDKISNWSLR